MILLKTGKPGFAYLAFFVCRTVGQLTIASIK
ncbi:hypothetical protein BN8_06041 [Fibrisoma limi BUZ 3]|uniref:Uncharacterized protein n=1 Tax=Fibrisoma limi BUZ 3 TaxID=1185876 RepID=I2GRY3_9BACT|nr:hypothetical protein BN8_06041 [Fibrisoma limi BUZ 3]